MKSSSNNLGLAQIVALSRLSGRAAFWARRGCADLQAMVAIDTAALRANVAIPLIEVREMDDAR